MSNLMSEYHWSESFTDTLFIFWNQQYMGKVKVDHFIHLDFQLTIIKVGHNISEKLTWAIEVTNVFKVGASNLEVTNDDVKTKG